MLSENMLELFRKKNYDVFHKIATVSTMVDAKDYLSIKKKNCIIISETQTDGHGRRGSYWHSPKGNVYCSISFENLLEIKKHFLYSMLICVSIKMTLDKFKIKKIKFKWPNDIFYNKQKFGGIINDIINISSSKSYIVMGFGININSSPSLKEYETTYVNSFCDHCDKYEFLNIFFKILFINLDNIYINKSDDLIKTFKKSLMFIGEKIEIVLPNGKSKFGIFKDINNDGSLQLSVNGDLQDIYNGSIKI